MTPEGTVSAQITQIAVPEITPFWQRMPKFFLYPLHTEPLLYMGFLAAATLLGFVLPVPSPFDHLIVHAGVWLAFIRYAYKTLDQTARGLLTPDQHKYEADPERTNLPYKQFGIFMVMGFALSVAQAMGGLVLGAVTIFATLAMPASVMILALTRSFWAGLNPLGVMSMMSMIGLPYLGLCAFLFLLMASEQALSVFLAPLVSPWLLLPVVNFVSMYFTLIMFNMMGYVVHQYHGALGVDQDAKAGPAVGAKEESGAEAIGRLVGAGQIDQALELAYEEQRIAPENLAVQQRYHKLLQLAGRTDRLLSHGPRYLSLLLKKGMGGDALALYKLMQGHNEKFETEQPAQLLELAEAARKARDFTQALALVKGFDKRFPRNPAIPSVYLFAAKILCENYKQESGARQILKTLTERYPEHPAGIEARQYLAVLDKLAQPAPSTAGA
jgi:hypothetical protein